MKECKASVYIDKTIYHGRPEKEIGVDELLGIDICKIYFYVIHKRRNFIG